MGNRMCRQASKPWTTDEQRASFRTYTEVEHAQGPDITSLYPTNTGSGGLWVMGQRNSKDTSFLSKTWKMASPISCLSILVIPLLVASLFCQVSNAVDEAFLENICQKTVDYEFCQSTLRSDARTFTANTDGLVLISISITVNHVLSTNDQIPNILKTLTDPLDKTRLQNCQTDYNEIVAKLNAAYSASDAKSYQEVINLLSAALIKRVECDDEYRLTPPIRDSPLSNASIRLQKLVDIAWVIIEEII
ncbi:hypothetical protein SO802_024927 [Lithocarpus litseifolius]|uniref:Pectinesterase inhibitor domain-containing protein n=1 Tax=Lithocarpus litseifolius TaxID=425828 RepID=A0AAW2CEB7_9ROSI